MAYQEASWVESYYETLNFFYWEPQHIARKKYADPRLKTESEVQSHLRKMEVTLNHQIKHFLCLAPGSFRNRLFTTALSRQVAGHFVLAGSDEAKVCRGVQPDFLFTSEASTVSLEMKIGAKSSVKQILKYALLALAVERDRKREMEHSLIFLGAGDFSSLFHRHLSVGDLRQRLETEKSNFFKEPTGKKYEAQEDDGRFSQIVSSFSLGFLNYNQFDHLLCDELASTDGCSGAQVYRNLVDGMRAELKRRELAG